MVATVVPAYRGVGISMAPSCRDGHTLPSMP